MQCGCHPESGRAWVIAMAGDLAERRRGAPKRCVVLVEHPPLGAAARGCRGGERASGEAADMRGVIQRSRERRRGQRLTLGSYLWSRRHNKGDDKDTEF